MAYGFSLTMPNGPWQVSTTRPDDVDRIPPSYPVYNSKYVYVYDATPDYVYTGYTPGYLNAYVYGPTLVYGTGYYYRPWWRHHYYARPYTWGFSMNYTPWYGWGFGYGFGYDWFDIGFGLVHGGAAVTVWWLVGSLNLPAGYCLALVITATMDIMDITAAMLTGTVDAIISITTTISIITAGMCMLITTAAL